MTGRGDPAAVAAPRLATEEVADWLRRHPDFLAQNPELLAVLTPPAARNGDSVVDFQRFMMARLQDGLARADATAEEVITATRINLSTQARVHDAVLALLDADSFEHLIHIATQDLCEHLDVDAISLCVEAERDPLPRISTAGVYVLPPGAVDELMGSGRDVLLRARSADTESIFGPAASLVRSDALVRLQFGPGAPPGLFALGARETEAFHPGQGSELLLFLARVLERCIRAWLELPAR